MYMLAACYYSSPVILPPPPYSVNYYIIHREYIYYL